MHDLATSSSSLNHNNYDISLFCNKILSQNEIYDILNKVWTPEINYKFPITSIITSEKDQKVRNLKFQYSWLVRFPWLSYSGIQGGAFCKFCVTFSKSHGGHNSQLLGSLVLKKFNNWKHAVEIFTKHSTLEYHQKCFLDATNFSNILKNPTMSIEQQLDTGRVKQITENRNKIKPIIEAIILCGRQNISLRGHRDDGRLVLTKSDDNDIKNNKGNFREILRYRAQGDLNLKMYLESDGTIKYTSKTSQNSIIEACNSVLLKNIVARVNDAKCFSILADETANISGVEQMSLCIIFVDLNKLVLCEEFLQFVPAHDITGKGLANLILESLKQFGVELKFLRGQGYDGAASMPGIYNGVQRFLHTSQTKKRFITKKFRFFQ